MGRHGARSETSRAFHADGAAGASRGYHQRGLRSFDGYQCSSAAHGHLRQADGTIAQGGATPPPRLMPKKAPGAPRAAQPLVLREVGLTCKYRFPEPPRSLSLALSPSERARVTARRFSTGVLYRQKQNRPKSQFNCEIEHGVATIRATARIQLAQ